MAEPDAPAYADFEISIGARGDRGTYAVSVLRAPAGGEAAAELDVPFKGLELENRLQGIELAVMSSIGARRRMLSPEQQRVEEFGRAMFDALFSGDVRTSFDLSREVADASDQGLRVKLRILAPELAHLPWELLYDPRRAEYLCLSRATPIVRYPEVPLTTRPLRVQPPLRILAMCASPDDLPPINVPTEKRRLQEALREVSEAGAVELTWLDTASPRQLQAAMQRGPWHVFHFVGHGSYDPEIDEGVIALVDEHGERVRLTATQLARLLGDQPSLRLAVLNACESARGGTGDVFSGTAQVLVRRGIPAAIAMQYEISDGAALEFSRSFYEEVAKGSPVDAAVTEARKAISVSAQNTVEWATPVLYMRAPDGVIFDIATPVLPAKPPAKPPKPEPPRAEKPPRRPVSRRAKIGVLAVVVALLAGSLAFVLWPDHGAPAGATLHERLVVVSDAGNRHLVIGYANPATNAFTPYTGVTAGWFARSLYVKDGVEVAVDPTLTAPLEPIHFDPTHPEGARPLDVVPRNAVAWDLSTHGLAYVDDHGCLCWNPGGGARTVTTLDAAAGIPYVRVSPSGRWIAYWFETSGLFVVPTAGGSPIRVTDAQVDDLSWDPCGDAFAYSAGNANSGNLSVWLATAGPEIHPTQETPDEVSAGGVAWAPDSNRLAYSTVPDRSVRLLDLKTGRDRKWLSVPGDGIVALAWGADGDPRKECPATPAT